MEAHIVQGINLAVDYFNSLPNRWLYAAGVVVASLPLTVLVLQAVKRLHFRYTGLEMTNHFIDFVLLITSFLMAAADFVITNGNNLKYLPQFLLVVVPTIKALAPTVFEYSKAINSWFKSRQTETQKERLSALGKSLDGLSQTTSLPNTTATTNTTTVPSIQPRPTPSQDLLQL